MSKLLVVVFGVICAALFIGLNGVLEIKRLGMESGVTLSWDAAPQEAIGFRAPVLYLMGSAVLVSLFALIMFAQRATRSMLPGIFWLAFAVATVAALLIYLFQPRGELDSLIGILISTENGFSALGMASAHSPTPFIVSLLAVLAFVHLSFHTGRTDRVTLGAQPGSIHDADSTVPATTNEFALQR